MNLGEERGLLSRTAAGLVNLVDSLDHIYDKMPKLKLNSINNDRTVEVIKLFIIWLTV